MAVTIEEARERLLASVARRVPRSEIARSFKPALDQVWAFLNARPGLRTDGRNVFAYRNFDPSSGMIDVEFGVEVARSFEPSGDVRPASTPAGRIARAVHCGPYERLGDTYAALDRWAAEAGACFAGVDWEIYGDWREDASLLETTVCRLLR